MLLSILAKTMTSKATLCCLLPFYTFLSVSVAEHRDILTTQ